MTTTFDPRRPLDQQLKELKGGAQWTIATAREYLSFQERDPWEGFWKKRQSLEKAIGMLPTRRELSK